MTVFNLLNPDSTEVEDQRVISAPGATTGDVLTVNADDTISPAPGGGSRPVTCYTQAVISDLVAEAQHPARWNALYDDPWNQNALLAIPSGLGLTFAFDGTDNTITATEAGFWALSFGVSVAADATWRGTLSDGFAQVTSLVLDKVAGLFRATHAPVYSLPAAAFFPPYVETLTAPTGTPQATVSLVIVRLG